MNTQTCLTTHASQFTDALYRLMFEDGFGFDEALVHAEDYARCIFRKPTPTAVLRVRNALRREERSALAY
jgi:hypothetical protein